MNETTSTIADDEKTLIVERTFDAPKSRVRKAHSTRELLRQWWEPRAGRPSSRKKRCRRFWRWA